MTKKFSNTTIVTTTTIVGLGMVLAAYNEVITMLAQF